MAINISAFGEISSLLSLQDGSILAWRYNAATNCFEPAASLMGHTLAVVTLYVGANRLYSGSMDKSIKVSTSDSSFMLELRTPFLIVLVCVW